MLAFSIGIFTILVFDISRVTPPNRQSFLKKSILINCNEFLKVMRYSFVWMYTFEDLDTNTMHNALKKNRKCKSVVFF